MIGRIMESNNTLVGMTQQQVPANKGQPQGGVESNAEKLLKYNGNAGSNIRETQAVPNATGSANANRQTSTTNPDRLEEAVNEIAKDLSLLQTRIAIRFDKESETSVMEVIDRDTGEVIRQVPPEEILKIRKNFQRLVTGFLVSEKA